MVASLTSQRPHAVIIDETFVLGGNREWHSPAFPVTEGQVLTWNAESDNLPFLAGVFSREQYDRRKRVPGTFIGKFKFGWGTFSRVKFTGRILAPVTDTYYSVLRVNPFQPWTTIHLTIQVTNPSLRRDAADEEGDWWVPRVYSDMGRFLKPGGAKPRSPEPRTVVYAAAGSAAVLAAVLVYVVLAGYGSSNLLNAATIGIGVGLILVALLGVATTLPHRVTEPMYDEGPWSDSGYIRRNGADGTKKDGAWLKRGLKK